MYLQYINYYKDVPLPPAGAYSDFRSKDRNSSKVLSVEQATASGL
jgi:hypothetical protein